MTNNSFSQHPISRECFMFAALFVACVRKHVCCCFASSKFILKQILTVLTYIALLCFSLLLCK